MPIVIPEAEGRSTFYDTDRLTDWQETVAWLDMFVNVTSQTSRNRVREFEQDASCDVEQVLDWLHATHSAFHRTPVVNQSSARRRGGLRSVVSSDDDYDDDLIDLTNV